MVGVSQMENASLGQGRRVTHIPYIHIHGMSWTGKVDREIWLLVPAYNPYIGRYEGTVLWRELTGGVARGIFHKGDLLVPKTHRNLCISHNGEIVRETRTCRPTLSARPLSQISVTSITFALFWLMRFCGNRFLIEWGKLHNCCYMFFHIFCVFFFFFFNHLDNVFCE